MDLAEFVTLSGRLVSMGKAGARSAVSRAYYGCFHLTLSVLDEVASAPPANGTAHNLAPRFLEAAGHPDSVAASRLLVDLLSERLKADYRLILAKVETVDFAKNAVESAVRLQRHLNSFRASCLSDEVARERVEEGIADLKERMRLPK